MKTASLQIANPSWESSLPTDTSHVDNGWRGALKLTYAFKDNRTWLLGQTRQGPLFVQKPFYPEGPETCHTYIVHPPGGVVGGDRLNLDVIAGSNSRVLITTPAASKFYRSSGATAAQINRLEVGTDAVLEWLPQETIVFNGAQARMRTIVKLEPGARFIGWEMICLGLPACSQPFVHGRIDQCFEIWQEERPLIIDPLRIGPHDALLTACWGMAGRPVIGILAATVDAPDVVDAIRRQTAIPPSDGLFAVTRVPGLILCRYLGANVYTGLKLFIKAWEVLRRAVKGREACAPRIWAT
jgi:urease accessory protein